MSNSFKNILLGLFMAFLTVVLIDAYEFYSIADQKYQSPWFSNSFIKDPYTTFFLNSVVSEEHKKTYWTGNDYQRWFVLEIEYNGKRFWTILENHSIKS